MTTAQVRPRRRWVVVVLLVAYAAVAAVVLLAPVSYGRVLTALDTVIRDDLGAAWIGPGWIEFVANILMFVPLGLLLTLLWRRPWIGVVLSLAVSAGAELIQIVIPLRQPSLRDIVANVLGAAVGAAIAMIVLRRAVRPRSGSSA